ncbi:hypothetical protein MPAR168_19990 [Methylorubrum populi]|uniref:Response regulatory domain-containing protein n=1 Tax=Methylobacterium radiotolerans TaxID=31998 RepID=A0ABU7T4S4_9HYPH
MTNAKHSANRAVQVINSFTPPALMSCRSSASCLPTPRWCSSVPNIASESQSIPRSSPAGRQGPLVVIAEDETAIRATTCAALAREGFRVIAASTCDEALTCLRNRPDGQVLITDVVTPGRADGYERARIASMDFPHVALLITSAQSQPRYGDIVLGAWFLAKPVDLNVLGRVVRECLGASHRKHIDFHDRFSATGGEEGYRTPE